MSLGIFKLFVLSLLPVLLSAAAPEPLAGTWTLSSQTVDGKKVDSEPMTLRIYADGDGLDFAYSIPVNGIHLVSMKFVSVHLDGREAAVQDVRGKKMGTVRVTKTGPLAYIAVIEGANRPKATGKMTVSPDGKTLTSESSHAIQVFARH